MEESLTTINLIIADDSHSLKIQKDEYDLQTRTKLASATSMQNYILEYSLHKKLEDTESQAFDLHQIAEFKIQYVYITIPHNTEVRTYVNTEQRTNRFEYILEGTKIKLEKFKKQRKTETVVYELQTLRNLNQSFEETYKAFVKKNTASDEQDEPSSPQFGVTKPEIPRPKVMKVAGNDGMSQAEILKKSAKMTHKIELKPYNLQQVYEHRTEEDAWTVINGKIYDVTFYLNHHPGGKAKLMEGVGRDGTQLFCIIQLRIQDHYHPWVNAHFILEKFQVGFLIK